MVLNVYLRVVYLRTHVHCVRDNSTVTFVWNESLRNQGSPLLKKLFFVHYRTWFFLKREKKARVQVKSIIDWRVGNTIVIIALPFCRFVCSTTYCSVNITRSNRSILLLLWTERTIRIFNSKVPCYHEERAWRWSQWFPTKTVGCTTAFWIDNISMLFFDK